MPIITKDLFGKNNFNRTYGYMYLSYGISCCYRNLYTSILIDSSVSLGVIFIPIMGISIASILYILFIKIKSAPSK